MSKISYVYPSCLEEMKTGDEYQIRFPVFKDVWHGWTLYNSNICDTKKRNLKYLIDQKRVRIIKREKDD